MKIQSLIIIGNGFDLAHGIQSNYSDFHKYLTEYEKISRTQSEFFFKAKNKKILEDSVRKYLLLNKLETYIPSKNLWSSFETSLGCFDYEKLKKHYFDYIKNDKVIPETYETNDKFPSIIQKELNFTDDIQYLFQNWISGLNTNVCTLPSILKIFRECILPVRFLNFNYTNILEQVYCIPRRNILYIHGKVDESRKLILGHHDDSLWKEEKFKPEEKFQETKAYQIIRNYFKKTYKNTEKLIIQNKKFFLELKDCKRVYILGHSLSEIDFNYFLEIRRNSKSDCEWIISCKSNSDLERAERLIKHLDIDNYYIIRI